MKGGDSVGKLKSFVMALVLISIPAIGFLTAGLEPTGAVQDAQPQVVCASCAKPDCTCDNCKCCNAKDKCDCVGGCECCACCCK